MDELKLKNGSSYELVVGGVFALSDEKLQITILPGSKTFLEIETDFQNEANTEHITIISNFGDTINIRRDFTSLESISKINDYVIGREQITTGEFSEDGTEMFEYNDIKGTVYTIILNKPDLREQIRNMQDAIDTLVLNELGV